MKIQELANRSGIDAKTIRYYEDIQLLPLPKRRSNGYRYYDDSDVERLEFVRRCKALQLPLSQLKTLVAIRDNENASCREVDAIINEQLEQTRKQLKELAALERTLEQLATSCQMDRASDCVILSKLGKSSSDPRVEESHTERRD